MTREEQLEELERVLGSRTLHGSESLKAFLKFVVLQTVDNGHTSLKEYTIATEVFGRGDNYDSRNDSVVRVQAGRLRTKLQEYYSSEGRSDPIVIDLPKGHYTPVFSYAPANTTGNEIEHSVQVAHFQNAPDQAVPVSRQGRSALYKVAIATLAVLALVAGSVALDYRSDNNHLKQELASREEGISDVQAALPIWDPLLKSPDPILVSFSNALFEGTAETGMKLMKPFEGPVQGVGEPAVPGTNPSMTAQSKNPAVITDHYTGVGEVMAMYSLASFFAKAGRTFRVKRSLLLSWDDITAANIVF
ncbi:MAG TPA: hypothetical protein VEZ90_15710, partial [Blastocatellia bacterium]|nr:hypothetical protein [Blastocatellia bacterium]